MRYNSQFQLQHKNFIFHKCTRRISPKLEVETILHHSRGLVMCGLFLAQCLFNQYPNELRVALNLLSQH